MELLEIIIFSVKIFALVSALIVISSYFIYKLKDRKRDKPYAKIQTQPLTPVLSATPGNINPDFFENIHNSNMPTETIQYDYRQYDNVQYHKIQVDNNQNQNIQLDNPQYQNPQTINIQYENQPMVLYQKNQQRSYGQRFKILNEDDNSTTQRRHVIEKLQPVTAAPQKFSNQRQANVFNIYDHYSSSNFEPMHKIKL
jgi:hypothetical protein